MALSVPCIAIGPFFALGDENRLAGEQIAELLPEIEAIGDGTRQTFGKNGDTLYVSNGRESRGRWQVQGDDYCSIWPPSDRWTCYNVVLEGDWKSGTGTLIWTDPQGNRSRNSIRRIAGESRQD